jgi:hypothetical protein
MIVYRMISLFNFRSSLCYAIKKFTDMLESKKKYGFSDK